LFNKKFGKNLSVREIEMAKQDLETLKNNTRIPLNVASRGTGKAVYRDNKYIPTSKAGDFSDSDVRTIGQVSGQFRVTTGETDPNSGKAVVRPSMYELITTYNIDSQSERDALLLNEADQGEDVRYNIVDEDRSSSTRVSVSD
jgi:hypothetical protein